MAQQQQSRASGKSSVSGAVSDFTLTANGIGDSENNARLAALLAKKGKTQQQISAALGAPASAGAGIKKAEMLFTASGKSNATNFAAAAKANEKRALAKQARNQAAMLAELQVQTVASRISSSQKAISEQVASQFETISETMNELNRQAVRADEAVRAKLAGLQQEVLKTQRQIARTRNDIAGWMRELDTANQERAEQLAGMIEEATAVNVVLAAGLAGKMNAMKGELGAEIRNSEARVVANLGAEIKGAEARLGAQIADLGAQIAAVRVEIANQFEADKRARAAELAELQRQLANQQAAAAAAADAKAAAAAAAAIKDLQARMAQAQEDLEPVEIYVCTECYGENGLSCGAGLHNLRKRERFQITRGQLKALKAGGATITDTQAKMGGQMSQHMIDLSGVAGYTLSDKFSTVFRNAGISNARRI